MPIPLSLFFRPLIYNWCLSDEPEKGKGANGPKRGRIRMVVIRIFLFSLSLLLLTHSLSMGDSLPQSIGSLRLEQLQSGEEARQEIDRLHGKQLNFGKGYIGIYKDKEGNRKGRLWVSEYDSEMEAAEAIGKMARRVQAKEGGEFWHFRVISIEGTQVYFVVGMGRTHYFFQKGKKVIWLAADPSEARQAIRDLIGKIP